MDPVISTIIKIKKKPNGFITLLKWQIFLSIIAGIALTAYRTMSNPVPELSDITYDEIIAVTKKDKNLTTKAKLESQFYPYIGKKVEWSGWVYEASVKKDHIEVLVDMESPDILFSVQDVIIATKDRKALSLNVDQEITFEGEIAYMYNVLNKYMIYLKKAKIK
jgi:hypothetical protein